MVASKPLQILRSITAGARPTGAPAGRPPYIQGEPYVNYTDRQFGVLDPSNAPFDLIGVPFFSTGASYVAGAPVVYQGVLYTALGPVAPGAFNPAQWLQSTPFANPGGFVNRLLNGAFDVWQRGTSLSAPWGTYVFTADQWVMETDQPVTVSVAAGTGTGRSLNALQIGGAVNLSEAFLIQFMEGAASAPLAGRQATFQIRAQNFGAAPLTPVFYSNYASAFNDFGSLVEDYTLPLQAVGPGQTVTLAVSFPVHPNAVNGYTVAVNFPSGYVWVADADFRSTPGAPTGLNPSPPIPELRPIGLELTQCQRFYEFGRTFVTSYGAVGTVTTPQTFFTMFKRNYPDVEVVDVQNVYNCSNLRNPIITENGFIHTIDVDVAGYWGLVYDWTASIELVTATTPSHLKRTLTHENLA
jgi:hypothetical protein